MNQVTNNIIAYFYTSLRCFIPFPIAWNYITCHYWITVLYITFNYSTLLSFRWLCLTQLCFTVLCFACFTFVFRNFALHYFNLLCALHCFTLTETAARWLDIASSEPVSSGGSRESGRATLVRLLLESPSKDHHQSISSLWKAQAAPASTSIASEFLFNRLWCSLLTCPHP